MTKQEIKRRIDLKLMGLQLVEAKHRRWMQMEAEKIKALRIKLQELEDATTEPDNGRNQGRRIHQVHQGA